MKSSAWPTVRSSGRNGTCVRRHLGTQQRLAHGDVARERREVDRQAVVGEDAVEARVLLVEAPLVGGLLLGAADDDAGHRDELDVVGSAAVAHRRVAHRVGVAAELLRRAAAGEHHLGVPAGELDARGRARSPGRSPACAAATDARCAAPRRGGARRRG